MIPLQDTLEQVERSGFDGAQHGFTIEADAFMFQNLSKNLYSDPYRAIVREYGTNAYDANPKEPFEVHAPNALEPWFSVRDYGPGLSEEEVFTVYNSYGKSTKKATNEAIGFFGLGAKSAFSVTKNWAVRSYQKGTCKTYDCYYGEEGKPKITLVATCPSDTERDGVEVRIPIHKDHFGQVARDIVDIYQWFNPTPTCKGVTIPSKEERVLKLALLCGKDAQWFINEEYKNDWRTLFAVQGFIVYPVKHDSLPLKRFSQEEQEFLRVFSQGLFIRFPIGTLSLAPSREMLHMDEKTIENLRQGIRKAHDGYVEIQKEYYDSIQGNDYEKYIWVASQQGSTRFALVKDKIGLVSSKGYPFTTSHMQVEKREGVQWYEGFYEGGSGYKFNPREVTLVDARKSPKNANRYSSRYHIEAHNAVFFMTEEDRKGNWKQRILNFLNTTTHKKLKKFSGFFVVDPKDTPPTCPLSRPSEFKERMFDSPFVVLDFQKEVPEITVEVDPNAPSSPKKTRPKANPTSFKGYSWLRYPKHCINVGHTNWFPQTYEYKDGGVYVECKSREVKEPWSTNVLNTIRDYGFLPSSVTLVGVPENNIGHFKRYMKDHPSHTWKTLEDYLKGVAIDTFSKYQALPSLKGHTNEEILELCTFGSISQDTFDALDYVCTNMGERTKDSYLKIRKYLSDVLKVKDMESFTRVHPKHYLYLKMTLFPEYVPNVFSLEEFLTGIDPLLAEAVLGKLTKPALQSVAKYLDMK